MTQHKTSNDFKRKSLKNKILETTSLIEIQKYNLVNWLKDDYNWNIQQLK